MGIRITVVILIIAISGVFSGKLRASRTAVDQLPPLEAIPGELGEWWSEDIPMTDIERRVLAADATVNRLYRRGDGTQVWLFIAYFAEQQVNSQIHSPRNCLPGAGWRVASLETRDLDIGGQPRSTTCMRIASERQAEDVYYWFRTRAGRIAGEYALKFDLVKNSLAGRPTDAAFIRVISSRPEAAEAFMERLHEPLDQVLGEIGL